MGFKFENKVSIDIDGHNFLVDTTLLKVVEASETAANDSSKLAVSEGTVEQQSQELADICTRYLIDVLGPDSIKTIWEGRVINASDLQEVTMYVMNQIKEFKINKIKRLNKIIAPKSLS